MPTTITGSVAGLASVSGTGTAGTGSVAATVAIAGVGGSNHAIGSIAALAAVAGVGTGYSPATGTVAATATVAGGEAETAAAAGSVALYANVRGWSTGAVTGTVQAYATVAGTDAEVAAATGVVIAFPGVSAVPYARPTGFGILEIATEAAWELGCTVPETLFPSYDEGENTPQRLRRAIIRTAQFLASTWDWQALRREQTWTTVNSTVQVGMVPDDFLRFVNDTFWDRTSKFKLRGPVSPDEWQQAVSWSVGAVVPWFCVRGGEIQTYPAPKAGYTYTFEYVTNAIGKDTAGNQLRRFASDSDVTWWDDELMIQGTIAAYREMLRLDSAQDRMAFERLMADRIKQDGARRKINMGGRGMTAEDRLAEMRSAAVIIKPN